MQSRPTRWVCEPYEVAVAERLAAGLGLSRPVGAVLARRGFAEVEEARRFLAAEERHDPLTLPGVPRACELILAHLRRGSRIAVFGDYDVDGVCSTAILVRALRALGGDPAWELPSRFDEGYGLSTAAVERLAARGVGLLVTVDCGITAVEQAAAARAAGLDVVVTDHHRPGAGAARLRGGAPGARRLRLPRAVRVRGGAQAVRGAARGRRGRSARGRGGPRPRRARHRLRPRSARDENRRIVREGLVALARTRKPGLRALMRGGLARARRAHRARARLPARPAHQRRRAHAAAPTPRSSCSSPRSGARAEEVAASSICSTATASEAETRILFAAEAACLPQASQAAIVVEGEGWHPGVVGIVASRLVERWRRPCVVDRPRWRLGARLGPEHLGLRPARRPGGVRRAPEPLRRAPHGGGRRDRAPKPWSRSGARSPPTPARRSRPRT